MTPVPVPETLREYFARSTIALSLAATGEDHPLVLVNPSFCALTGYEPDDIIGRNCRFLQRDRGQHANTLAREQIHAFLSHGRQDTVRTPIVNFRKDGIPFVNLLYMSKLRDLSGKVQLIFASQFDVSRAQPDLLRAYDDELGTAVTRLRPMLADNGVVFEGSLASIANTASTIAQAKMTLAQIEDEEA